MKSLACVAADATIRIWDMDQNVGKWITTLEGHMEGISDISWAPDSQVLASASDDKTVRIWHIPTVSDPRFVQRCEHQRLVKQKRQRKRF